MRGVAASVFVTALLATSGAAACPTCRPAVQAGIFDERFWGRLSITILPFLVILLVVAVLHRSGRREAGITPARPPSSALPGEERFE